MASDRLPVRAVARGSTGALATETPQRVVRLSGRDGGRPRAAGGRRSEVKAERRAKPGAGDMSGGGRSPPLADTPFAVASCAGAGECNDCG